MRCMMRERKEHWCQKKNHDNNQLTFGDDNNGVVVVVKDLVVSSSRKKLKFWKCASRHIRVGGNSPV